MYDDKGSLVFEFEDPGCIRNLTCVRNEVSSYQEGSHPTSYGAGITSKRPSYIGRKYLVFAASPILSAVGQALGFEVPPLVMNADINNVDTMNARKRRADSYLNSIKMARMTRTSGTVTWQMQEDAHSR